MTGIFVCACGRRTVTASWCAKVAKSVGVPRVFGHENLCGADGIRLVGETARKGEMRRLLLAGCAALHSEGCIRALSKESGVPAAAIFPVLLPPAASAEEAAGAIRRAHDALEFLPVFETRRVALRREVLVVGGGIAGMEAARQVASLGYPTTLVEREDRLGGAGVPGSDFGVGAVPGGAEVEITTGTTLESLTGAVGNFSALLKNAAGRTLRSFGAAVIAAGARIDGVSRAPFTAGTVIPLRELEKHIDGLSRRNRPRSVAIILDLEVDETKTSSETAFRTALAVRERFRTEVTILARDVRVSSLGLEKLYDEARESGIAFLKYEGSPKIGCAAEGVAISCKDGVAGEEVELSVGLAAVSPYGLPTPVAAGLDDAVGVAMDASGHLQENNIHLLPGLAGRTGVFVIGSCRGETYEPNILRDARDVALSVHQLLSQKEIEVELSHPVVDGDKCVLCLTCIRSCPFKAMRIFAEEKKADCIPEACRRCGICAGECPAKAIELPAYSDRIVLARAGA